jgi:hypothetical protein
MCMYGSEKNCVGVYLFYILNKDMLRKVIVKIRKIISTNNNCANPSSARGGTPHDRSQPVFASVSVFRLFFSGVSSEAALQA